MINLLLNELKLIAKSRLIKGYKNMSKERLLSAHNESKSIENEKNSENARIKKMKKDFNELTDRFFKPIIKSLWNRKQE